MSRQEDIQKLLTHHYRRLQKLEAQRAIKGHNTPPETLTEIEDIEAEIDKLFAELHALGSSRIAGLKRMWYGILGYEDEGVVALPGWAEALPKYQEKMEQLHGTIRVLGRPDPVPLTGIFTDVYILDKPVAFRRFDIDQLPLQAERLEEGGKRQDGLALVRQDESRRLFILGGPGAGKTTFLKYLALQAARQKLDRLPVFVPLKEWSDSGRELLPFIGEQFAGCGFREARFYVDYMLRQGRAIVLFDGLDEVGREGGRRERTIATLKRFGDRYHQAQCLITCRIAATEYQFPGYRYVQLADFTAAQMETYARNWFGDNEKKREMFLAEFQQPEHKGLRELARTPLLLALLCLNFDETMAFPRRRVDLYEEALDALLKKWDASRSIRRDEIYHKLSPGRKKQLLARLAAETFEEGEYYLPQRKIEEKIVAYLRNLPPVDGQEEIDGEAVLKAIEAQHGLLVERAHRIYGFSHLTFQEYFTAKYIVDNAAGGTLPRLIDNHLTDDRWREVFLLTASLLPQADDFFAGFSRAISGLITGDETLEEIIGWATAKAGTIAGDYKPAALRTVYVAFGRGLDHALALVLARDRAYALDRVRVFDCARALDRDRALDRIRARAIVSALALDLALDLARSLDLPLDGDLSPPLSLDYNLTSALNFAFIFGLSTDLLVGIRHVVPDMAAYFAEVIEQSRAVDPDLAGALAALSVPGKDASHTAWRTFEKKLRQVTLTHRDIGHRWDLTEGQIERLAQYFEANRLLVECLELAYVKDRRAIEDGLLLPPGG